MCVCTQILPICVVFSFAVNFQSVYLGFVNPFRHFAIWKTLAWLGFDMMALTRLQRVFKKLFSFIFIFTKNNFPKQNRTQYFVDQFF